MKNSSNSNLWTSILALNLLLVGLSSGLTYPPDKTCQAAAFSPLSRPAYLSWVSDPVFGTELMRITDSAVFGQADVRHHYSKDQPWNSDQSLVMLNNGQILDGQTFARLRSVSLGDETRWSNTDPDKLFATLGNKFISINAATGARTTLHTFTGYTRVYLGPWEGNVSINDSMVVLVTSENSDAHIIVYDIAKDRVVADKSQTSLGYTGTGIDWASISQSGKYVVINGRGSSDNSAKSYDGNLNYVATLFSTGEHGDLGYDAAGNEVMVEAGYPGQMARLDNGAKTTIINCHDLLWGHISCRNYQRPGWAYVTSNQTDEVLAIKLDGSLTYERFTLHRSSESSYNAEAQGVPGPDGTMVMYASDWNSTAEINSYVVRARPPETLPETHAAMPRTVFTLSPNPVKGILRINFHLDNASRACMHIFNNQGRCMAENAWAFGSGGNYTTAWDSRNLPAGVYLVRFTTREETRLRRLVRIP